MKTQLKRGNDKKKGVKKKEMNVKRQVVDSTMVTLLSPQPLSRLSRFIDLLLLCRYSGSLEHGHSSV